MKHMKRFFTVLLAFASIFALVSCMDFGTPTEGVTTTFPAPVLTTAPPDTTPSPPTETTACTDCTTTASAVATPIEPHAYLLFPDGTAQDLHKELLWYTDLQLYSDGSSAPMIGDGHLMLMSVKSYGPSIADQISDVTLVRGTELVRFGGVGVLTSGGETCDVYDENFDLIGEGLTIDEVVEKGEGEWKGRSLYVYFKVKFYVPITGQWEKATMNGYFIRAVFA